MNRLPLTRHGAHETWELRKPAVHARDGLVATHHYAASAVGARMLAAGGNAIDAAVAASFAIGALEPWMSGLGGGGYMLVYLAGERRCYCVDFGMVAPRRLDPADYPLVSGADADLFGWPAVEGDRNVHGPLSVGVPGQVAGMSLALERFGSRRWAEVLAPAIELARGGLAVDWYATLKIAAEAGTLARYPASADIYLPGGYPPAAPWGGPLPRISLGKLAGTLERLAEAGAGDFYHGDIASGLADDARAAGCRLDGADLAAYRARIVPAETADYRGHQVHVAPGLTAGPSLQRALALLAASYAPAAQPDTGTWVAYARALARTYAERLAGMGEGSSSAPTCTTHLSVVDRDGNMVSLTQTLLSVFGSKLVLPQSGVLMNNAVMWFDPRPGGPNAIGPGKRPLSNMCPLVVERSDGLRLAAGASGGRRIMPSLLQLVSFCTDFRMDLDRAAHQPRIDVSGVPWVTVDSRLPAAVAETLRADFPVELAEHGVYPALFACPNAVSHHALTGAQEGAAYVTSPWAEVASASAVPR